MNAAKTSRARNLLLAVLISVLGSAGCATKSAPELGYARSGMECSPEVRKVSNAGDRLFSDMLNAFGGVHFVDRVKFPGAKTREITSIVVVVPYDNVRTGVERWTVQHDARDETVYVVNFIPDGRGGTTFAVQVDSEKAD